MCVQDGLRDERKVSRMKEKQEEKRKFVAKKTESVKTFIENTKNRIYETRKKRHQKKYDNGEVDLPVFRVGPNKKGVVALWILMGASLAFGVYKNFTAIDKETIHETIVVESKVSDTNEIESFVERFAYLYHAWGNGRGDKSTRQAALADFMTDELVNVNNNAVNSECPTVAEVENVRICEVTDLEDGDFEVRYMVMQKLSETVDSESMAFVMKNDLPIVATGTDDVNENSDEENVIEPEVTEFEGTQTGETAEDIEPENLTTEETDENVTSQLESERQQTRTGEQGITSITTMQSENGTMTITRRESFYMVVVHVDDTGSMVITKNPTACGVYGKSAYKPQQYQNDSSISTETMTDIQDFLNTFFNLYPTATEKELVYYAAPGTLDVINADFVYDGLVSATYYIEDEQIKVHLYVRYLDQTAKMTQLSEYTLTLEKGDNWKIVAVE